MKKIVMFIFLGLSVIACKTFPVKEEVICNHSDSIAFYKGQIDSLNNIIRVYEYNDSINFIVKDSIEYENCVLNYRIDSLFEEYYLDEYKLERIKEYNKIAANGNNIKYLRGWLNRVLNE